MIGLGLLLSENAKRSPDEKENLYDLLISTLNQTPKGDKTIIMGYLYAKVESDNMNLEIFMEKHILGTVNENGELLTNFCANNNFIIGGTIFPLKIVGYHMTYTLKTKYLAWITVR